MDEHGGKRSGAGRPAGSPNRATVDQKAKLSQLAKKYSRTAFETLVEISEKGKTDSARIAASIAILDRGYGKPREAMPSQYYEPSPLDFLD